MSNLIAALNPDDLDAMDESVPFSKFTLDELLGRYHTSEEYSYYFQHNPHSSRYREYFEELATASKPAREIIPSHKIPKPKSPSSMGKNNIFFGVIFVIAIVLYLIMLYYRK